MGVQNLADNTDNCATSRATNLEWRKVLVHGLEALKAHDRSLPHRRKVHICSLDIGVSVSDKGQEPGMEWHFRALG